MGMEDTLVSLLLVFRIVRHEDRSFLGHQRHDITCIQSDSNGNNIMVSFFGKALCNIHEIRASLMRRPLSLVGLHLYKFSGTSGASYS